ncbi:MAG TPA: PilZ domain-containing protein [Thermoanaerobaculia bacterium]|nr:PilZ domain-containing protein [Thermoanaerobaculia bacterium]
MSDRSKERRRYEHITLSRPIAGRLGSTKVFVVDISITGARVAHQHPLIEGEIARLRFEWQGQELAFDCDVLRTKPPQKGPDPSGVLYHTGLAFVDPVAESRAILRELITDHVMRALDEQRSNARGIPPIAPTFYQSGLRDRAGYVTMRLVQNSWKRTTTDKPDQPLDGFTISAKEPEDQIEMLCRTYQESDYEGRRMIRKMAELTIGGAEAVAARKYTP